MIITTSAFCASLLAIGLSGINHPAVPILACNLKAINAADRTRYSELVKRIRTSLHRRTEIGDGYRFELDSKIITLREAAEWIEMERLCCPFLTLQLSASGKQSFWCLTLTGPVGVKALIAAEFPVG